MTLNIKNNNIFFIFCDKITQAQTNEQVILKYKCILLYLIKIHIKQRSKKIPTKLSVQSENILIPV